MTQQTLSRRTVLAGLGVAASSLTAARPLQATETVWEVRISSFAFIPEKIVVNVGDKIRWINDDIAPHTATADGGSWDTGPLEKDDFGMIEVSAGMERTYFCVFHPHMRGSIEIM